MKFDPQTLLEIYLNGSFTEEAQAEFDALLRRDPSFAQKVTESLAQRLGPLPEGTEERISRNLEAKRDLLWKDHAPSPAQGLLKASLWTAVVLASAAGLYGGYHYWRSGQDLKAAASDGPSLEVPAPAPKPLSKGHSKPQAVRAEEAPGEGPGSVVLSFKQGLPGTVRPSAQDADSGSRVPSGQDLGARPGPAPRAPSPLASSSSSSSSQEGDALRVSVEMEKAGQAEVRVYDIRKSLVRTLFRGPWEAGLHLVDWDGKDSQGTPVAPGEYEVRVLADGKTLSGTVRIKSGR